MSIFSRFAYRFLLLILALVVGLSVYAIWSIRRPFPQVDGNIKISGLKAPVEILRDEDGVPHIYAANVHDLFLAQGYVHAQDRFWQMDFWRHVGSGRLSELLGESQLETDKFLRTMGWGRLAEREVEQLDPVSQTILGNYVEGINAYLVATNFRKLSLEHTLLSFQFPDYTPEPWTPAQSLTWGKVMSWDLGMNMDSEIRRALLLSHLSPEQVEELYPVYPSIHPFILPGGSDSVSRETNPSQILQQSELLPLLQAAQKSIARMDLLHPHESIVGSNNWVISGKKTSTGKPILANDPHLGEQMPSIWYQVHLQCVPQTPECPYNVAGFSFAGTPGVIIGHNDRIAWGFTNVGPDVMDLYIEKIHPEDPNLYEVNGEWKKMDLVQDEIKVAGGSTFPFTVRRTRHGPVISDTDEQLRQIKASKNAAIPKNFAVSLRWTALDDTNTFPAIWKCNLATNWEEFRNALREFDVPSQNVVYADVDGNIGYQVPGNIPIRVHSDGRYPVPGWTDEFEWQGFIPFDELPGSLNPPEGFIASANNAVTDNSYPYFITSDWDYGFRAQRIVEMIRKNSPITMETIQKMQGDNYDSSAEFFVPLLLQIRFDESVEQQSQALLKKWDFQAHMDSSAAAVYEVFWKNVLTRTFNDQLPVARPTGGSRWMEVMRLLVQQPESTWWDDVETEKRETRDEILKESFRSAVSELVQKLGNDPFRWNWGQLHTTTFHQQTLGRSGIMLIEAMFNRGPYPTSGGNSIVNATGWNVTHPYAVTGLPSMRMIVDLSNLNHSLSIHTTGQSGHPFHAHYSDMILPWTQIKYLPMRWDRSQFEQNVEGVLHLIPEP